jgi:hypothetical protein
MKGKHNAIHYAGIITMDQQNPAKHTIHLIGNAHIDPVWLWPWTDGYSEVNLLELPADPQSARQQPESE